uniref:sialate O-acetylesterase n=1 Tax=Bifidobacterium adolescentis TaxID=1680 RepID=UPI00359C5483
MNAKRMTRVVFTVVATVAVVLAIFIGCGPKWGNGSALHQTEGVTQSSNSQVSVTLPSYYMENMVFQRNQPLVVKGTVKSAHASEQIDASKLSTTLTQGKMAVSATAKIAKNGSFTCTLNAQKASLKPYSLQVRYDSKIVTELTKVYVGDVFVAAGQSNMELNYAQYYEGNNNAYNFGKGLVKKTDLPKPLVDKNVKFVIADHDVKNTDFPLANVNLNAGAWLNADSTNSLHLSYLTQQFALQLRAKHPNVPIGIIQTAWGGTPIRRHVQGGDIYANHIAPLKGFHVAGVLWYQGCDDANNYGTALQYESQMTTLINQYRNVFGRKDLPFLYVQLARWPNYQYTQNVREAQRTTLGNTNLHDSSNVAMTVSLDTDKGTSALIHPLGKDILGARMAAQYLAMEDGTTVPNGPLIERARHTANGAIALSFRNGTASRLKAMQPNYSKTASAIAPNYKSAPKATPLSGISNIAAPTTTALQGFEVANYSGQWQAVNATIRGNQVLLTAADGSILNDLNAMSQVRYLFSGNPKCASMLYNDFNLPASPFITIVE